MDPILGEHLPPLVQWLMFSVSMEDIHFDFVVDKDSSKFKNKVFELIGKEIKRAIAPICTHDFVVHSVQVKKYSVQAFVEPEYQKRLEEIFSGYPFDHQYLEPIPISEDVYNQLYAFREQ
jgi:hypothetical protein